MIFCKINFSGMRTESQTVNAPRLVSGMTFDRATQYYLPPKIKL